MSIAEFSEAMRNRALISWFDLEAKGGNSASAAARKKYSAENVNTLVNPSSDYRSAEQTAAKTSFVITKDTIRDLLKDLKGITDKDILEQQTEVYFAKFAAKGAGVKVNRKKITVGNGIPAVFFNSISFDSITNLVNSILDLNAGQLSTQYEKGHVIGVATALLYRTSTRISQIDARGGQGSSSISTSRAKEILLKELDTVIKYYAKLDFDSANIRPAEDVSLYASATKILSAKGTAKYLVELQPKVRNQASAKEVQATIGSIRKLFSPGNLSDQARLKILDNLIENVQNADFKNYLVNELRSSPTFLQMITTGVAKAAEGNPIDQKYNVPTVKVASKKVPSPDLKNIRALAQTEKRKLESLKKKIATKVRSTVNISSSTIALESLLRARLSDQVAKNMGTGDSKRLLNYRTGRFAKSVTFERLSVSRQGMITAFYSYMKNPYATFSEGGRQQYPRTRDPKTLISTSIRELAAPLVGNRLRSVSL